MKMARAPMAVSVLPITGIVFIGRILSHMSHLANAVVLAAALSYAATSRQGAQ